MKYSIYDITYNKVGERVEEALWAFLERNTLPIVTNQAVLSIADNIINEYYLTVELRNKMNLTIASNTITIPHDN